MSVCWSACGCGESDMPRVDDLKKYKNCIPFDQMDKIELVLNFEFFMAKTVFEFFLNSACV